MLYICGNILNDTGMNTIEKKARAAGRMHEKIHRLPPRVQLELSDYVDFLLQKYQTDKVRKPFFGCMKGTVVWMSDDFNAPLEEFKDYM
jgi:hypothetical protein